MYLARLKSNKIRTAHLPGYNHGLIVILDANIKDTGVSTGRSNGFKVILNLLNIVLYPPNSNLAISGAVA